MQKKGKSLRICLDPCPLNGAILRERHAIPTPSDVYAQLSGKSVFTVIEETFGDISGVHVIADDLIIAAANPQEHDHIMRLVLTRAREKRVRFNKDKTQFKIESVQCMGHIVSAQGLKHDTHKVQAITNMPPTDDVPSLQRLLGMTKYLSPAHF